MAAATIQSGIYFIQNAGTGTVLDLTGGSSVDGTKVQGYQKRELNDVWVSAQLWIITQVGNGPTYSIQNANSRTYMDLTNVGLDGSPIIGHPGGSGAWQRWIISRNSKNTAYVIANEENGTFVDLYNGNPANGTAVNGWQGQGSATENTHQLWHIVRA